MKKINLKEIPVAKVIGFLSIGAAAIGAAFTEIGNQKKEEAFKELTKRVTELENK